MAIYYSETIRFRNFLIKLVYDNLELSFHAVIYNLKGMIAFTTDKYMFEEFAKKQAIKWVYENDL